MKTNILLFSFFSLTKETGHMKCHVQTFWKYYYYLLWVILLYDFVIFQNVLSKNWYVIFCFLPQTKELDALSIIFNIVKWKI